MILDDIVADKREELAELKRLVPLVELKAESRDKEPTRDFKGALTKDGVRIITEVKKASPSKGLIRADFDPVAIASIYEEYGAAAISVLTEKKYFQGDLKYLTDVKDAVSIPVLRKDFIFDPYQLFEARVAGADAILLIAAVLGRSELTDLLGQAGELGLSVLVESHSSDELQKTVGAGAEIVGINNRDLNTFKTDIATTEELVKEIPDGKVIVSESGINTAEDIRRLTDSGADAFLIGEALMREADIGKKLAGLLA